jgi:hypothetical protein
MTRRGDCLDGLHEKLAGVECVAAEKLNVLGCTCLLR